MKKVTHCIIAFSLFFAFARGEEQSPAVRIFLEKFDQLSARGFVPTLRSGSTGIGYTLETLLEIEENNSPLGDFMGMELKAHREEDFDAGGNKKMNLFLKEPVWIDDLKHSERIQKYGYVDDNGRTALYSTVQIKENSHGFRFRIDPVGQRVFIQFRGEDVGFWTFKVLEDRLREKHSEAVFIAARTRGTGKNEEFHYYGVQWCRDPSIGAFINLIRAGDVVLELRMHIKESGSARNHGSAFRIRQSRIPGLYQATTRLRPVLKLP
ncbi:MAG: MvaI/BcnI family restriction endonuclease [Verrucomicrobiales bacterium]|nr:MvaI/BcnI family restriction endonuclease [Verrucomicrobiales bacterium]